MKECQFHKTCGTFPSCRSKCFNIQLPLPSPNRRFPIGGITLAVRTRISLLSWKISCRPYFEMKRYNKALSLKETRLNCVMQRTANRANWTNCNYFLVKCTAIWVCLYIFRGITFPSQNCNYLSIVWTGKKVFVFWRPDICIT